MNSFYDTINLITCDICKLVNSHKAIVLYEDVIYDRAIMGQVSLQLISSETNNYVFVSPSTCHLENMYFCSYDNKTGSRTILATIYDLLYPNYNINEDSIYVHYKTHERYKILCVSKSGNKECNQRYVTYYREENDSLEYYTRTIEDFLALVDIETMTYRFMEAV